MVRDIDLNDFKNILSIKSRLALDLTKLVDNNYIIDCERTGFLIPSVYSKEEFIQDLLKTFLVYVQGGKIVGYLRIDEKPELRKTTEVEWFKPEIKDVYYSYPHAEIGAVAVLKEYAGNKIASQMLIEAEREVKSKGNTYLFSLVAISPIHNHPSMKFHEKNDFERIALSKPHTLFGIENYQSVLFAKELG